MSSSQQGCKVPSSKPRERPRAESPSKSVKSISISIKSLQDWPSGSGSGIDSGNPVSSHAEREYITTAEQYLTLMEAVAVVNDVEDHLREKRFYLNQLWQLYSALDRFVCYQFPYHDAV